MRSTYIDEDTASRVRVMLDILKIYKLAQERGLLENVVYDFSLSADDEDWYYLYQEVLDGIGDEMFDTDDVSYHEVNSAEDEISTYFPNAFEFFDYENDGAVSGIVIHHPDVIAFYELCKANNILIEDTPFAARMYHADYHAERSTTYESYFEIFVPAEEHVRDKYPICIFYTDPTLFNSSVLESYYEAIDYCKMAIQSEEELQNLIAKRKPAGGEAL